MSSEPPHSEHPPARASVRERLAACAAKRRRRFWWNFASWATTVLIVLGVGALVHWRAISVLKEDRRLTQAEAEYNRALRSYRQAPGGLDRAAARFRAIIANYPDTDFARKAEEELVKIDRVRATRDKGKESSPDGVKLELEQQ